MTRHERAHAPSVKELRLAGRHSRESSGIQSPKCIRIHSFRLAYPAVPSIR